MATSRKTAAKAAARKTAAPANASSAGSGGGGGGGGGTDMLFESEDFKPIPAGVTQVVFKVVSAGADQSVSLGVGVFEQLGQNAPWITIDKRHIDNLPATPEGSFVSFLPRPGARYALTFLGEMHALSVRDAPLELALAVTADGVGTPLEDFDGPRSVDARFCVARGRALLRSAA